MKSAGWTNFLGLCSEGASPLASLISSLPTWPKHRQKSNLLSEESGEILKRIWEGDRSGKDVRESAVYSLYGNVCGRSYQHDTRQMRGCS
jgi:hypothetical protein